METAKEKHLTGPLALFRSSVCPLAHPCLLTLINAHLSIFTTVRLKEISPCLRAFRHSLDLLLVIMLQKNNYTFYVHFV